MCSRHLSNSCQQTNACPALATETPLPSGLGFGTRTNLTASTCVDLAGRDLSGPGLKLACPAMIQRHFGDLRPSPVLQREAQRRARPFVSPAPSAWTHRRAKRPGACPSPCSASAYAGPSSNDGTAPDGVRLGRLQAHLARVAWRRRLRPRLRRLPQRSARGSEAPETRPWLHGRHER